MKISNLLSIIITLIFLSTQAHAQMDILGIEEDNTIAETDDISQEDKNEPEKILESDSAKTADVLHPEEKDFFDGYIDDVEDSEKAKNKARDLLAQKPNILTLRDSQKKIIDQGKREREKLEERINRQKAEQERAKEKKEYIKNNFSQAPFGLFWKTSPQETKDLGFKIKNSERPDYQGVYIVKNQSQQETFEHILAIYGTQNRLWCIYAQSTPVTDNPNAGEILKIYKKYYTALEKKYGNAQEFFTPYRYAEEVVEETEDPKKPIITKVQHENPLGGPNFLEELKDDKASLYATFENKKVGVTLSVFVNKDNKSYIALDFKNLEAMQQEQEANMGELINDL